MEAGRGALKWARTSASRRTGGGKRGNASEAGGNASRLCCLSEDLALVLGQVGDMMNQACNEVLERNTHSVSKLFILWV